MPEYEYRCRDCQQLMSVERSMNASADERIGDCSKCGSADLVRIWGASFVAVGAKGSASSAQGEMCASNPAQPKSCCPCSG